MFSFIVTIILTFLEKELITLIDRRINSLVLLTLTPRPGKLFPTDHDHFQVI